MLYCLFIIVYIPFLCPEGWMTSVGLLAIQLFSDSCTFTPWPSKSADGMV